MKAIFYYNTSEAIKVDKDLEYIAELEIVFKTSVSIKNPIIDLELKFQNNNTLINVVDENNEDVVFGLDNDSMVVDYPFSITDFNYCYIPVLERYYFVNNPILVTDRIFRLELAEDVLMSFKIQYRELNAFISRNEFDYNRLVKDDLYPFEYKKEVLVKEVTNISSVDEFETSSLFNNCMVTYLTDDAIKYSNGDGLGPNYNLFGANMSTQYMISSITNLRRIASALYKDNVSLGYLKNIRIYPFEIKTDADHHEMFTNSITIGSKTITLDGGFYWPINPWYKIKIAEFDFSEFQSFAEYPPYTTYELWIPYYGWITLNPDVIAENNTLQLYYIVNFENGEAKVYLEDISESERNIVFSASVQLGVTVALSSTNARELENQKISNVMNGTIGLVGSAIQVGSGAFTGNPVAMAMGVMNATKTVGSIINNVNTMYEKANANINSASDGIFNPQKVLIKTTSLYDSLKAYGSYNEWKHLFGRPLNDVRKLSALSGYTVIGDINLDNVKAFENEKDELYDLLKSGIIL